MHWWQVVLLDVLAAYAAVLCLLGLLTWLSVCWCMGGRRRRHPVPQEAASSGGGKGKVE